MQVRVARHTERLGEVVAFYRDRIGLSEVGRFRNHDGYDGVFLAIPGADAHLEFTTGGAHPAPPPHPESLLVFYVGDPGAVRAIAARVGDPPVALANPYWAERALAFEDPDGFLVVLVPERWDPGGAPVAIRIAEHHGPRTGLRALFELAEDSAQALDAYMDEGRVLVALDREHVVAHVQITETGRAHELEIKNIAVDASMRGRGVGRSLVEATVALARAERRTALVVATATADIDNLRFYQGLGFRMRSVERDAFTEENGYPANLEIGGIALRDRIWLDRTVD